MNFTAAERAKIAEVARIKRRARQDAKAQRSPRVMPTAEGQRQPQVRNRCYLAWVRRLPCIAGLIEGGCNGPIEAAHVRMSVPGRPNPGMAAKPNDRWAVPLCRHHHQHDQHRGSERAFWQRLGVEPTALSQSLYSAFEDGVDGNELLCAMRAS